MYKAFWTQAMVATVAVVLLAWGMAMAGSHTQTLPGTLTAIDLDHGTVVVDAVVGDQKLTIAGPLADNAQLRKAGRSADLRAFVVGERVSISWQRTDKGLLIHRLEGRN